MYKILIVDDEQIVIDSLTHIIGNNFINAQIVASARSGREAIEKAQATSPDIVFMDISMPGINGIEAIEEIKKVKSNTSFIILSAFEQFDYAKEALKLGVVEYLLKPVSRVRIIEIVNKTIGLLQEQQTKLKSELDLKEKLARVVPIIENGFIYSLMLMEEDTIELSSYRSLFDLNENGGYVMTIEFGQISTNGSIGNKIGSSIGSQNFYPFVRETAKSLCKCFVGPVVLNKIVIFVPQQVEKNEYSGGIEAIKIGEKLWSKLTDAVKEDFKIGIGRACDCFELLPNSYNESIKALRFLKNCGVMHFMDMPDRETLGIGYPYYKEKSLMQKVSMGDVAQSIALIDELYEWLVCEYKNNTLKIKNKLLEIVFLVNRLGNELCENGERQLDGSLEELLMINDSNELGRWCRKQVESASKFIAMMRANKISIISKRAKEYIDKNYNKDISLEEVSRILNVSPQYFSKLFKEETNENFIDYVTSVRIIHAKELLEIGELSIKEICYNTGYSDPTYFSRAFKKIVNITPTEYREMVFNNKSLIIK